MNSPIVKLQFDQCMIAQVLKNQCNSIVKEENSSGNCGSGSPSEMSSGESDPDMVEKQLKHDNESPKDLPKVTSTSEKKLRNDSVSFTCDDTTTLSEHRSQYMQYQDLMQEKKITTTSQQTLTKMKVVVQGNNSFSHGFQDIAPIPFTPFQQLQQSRRQFAPQPEEFQIDLDNIEADGRTTLMIRNIPNKYSQEYLMQDINHKYSYQYDFFYLPIDFNNKCNVGYAFINFVDVTHIQQFYQQYHGQRWKMFNSDKVCQITYARIQGARELDRHFQFSSIINLKDNKMKPVFLNKFQHIVQQQKNKIFIGDL